MQLKLHITEESLRLFVKDLWKDQRHLEVLHQNDGKIIRRFADNSTTVQEECDYIDRLRNRINFRIPEIRQYTEKYMDFRYIEGTRAFNLLMDLKSLYTVEKMACYQELAIKLLELLQANLTTFQSVMMDDPLFTDNRSVYPATEKIRTLYQVLTAVLPETCSFSEIAEDLDRITALYEQDAVIPFRDATPKNILLEIPALFQLRFASYEERLATVKTLCLSGALNRLLDKEKVYQIDFSGCKFLCPLDDDWIALQDHESSAWLSLAEKSRHNRKDVSGLCTRFVRFSRFGGRKLAYRLLNHKGYNIRFVHDNEAIYFYSLIDICRSLKDHHIIRSDRLGNLMTDLHRMSGFTPEKDYLQAISPVNNRSVYYSDVFPG